MNNKLIPRFLDSSIPRLLGFNKQRQNKNGFSRFDQSVRLRIFADPHHGRFHDAVRIPSRSCGDIVRHKRVHHDEMRGDLRDVLSTIEFPSNPHVRRNKKHTTEITSSVDIAISTPYNPRDSPRRIPSNSKEFDRAIAELTR